MSEPDGMAVRLRAAESTLAAYLDEPVPAPTEADWRDVLGAADGPLAEFWRAHGLTRMSGEALSAAAGRVTGRQLWAMVAGASRSDDTGANLGRDADGCWYLARPWFAESVSLMFAYLVAFRAVERVLAPGESATLVIGNLWWGGEPRPVSVAAEVTSDGFGLLPVQGEQARALLADADELIRGFELSLEPYPDRRAEVMAWGPRRG